MPLNRPYSSLADLPSRAPVFPLEGVLLFPGRELPLNIFEPRYLAMIDDALKGDRLIGMIQPAPGWFGGSDKPRLADVGCLGRTTQIVETGDGRYALVLTGVARFRIQGELSAATPYRQCALDFGEFEHDLVGDPSGALVDRGDLIAAFSAFSRARGLNVDWSTIDDCPTEILVNSLAMAAPFSPVEKQALLEARDLEERARTLVGIARLATAAGGGPSQLH